MIGITEEDAAEQSTNSSVVINTTNITANSNNITTNSNNITTNTNNITTNSNNIATNTAAIAALPTVVFGGVNCTMVSVDALVVNTPWSVHWIRVGSRIILYGEFSGATSLQTNNAAGNGHFLMDIPNPVPDIDLGPCNGIMYGVVIGNALDMNAVAVRENDRQIRWYYTTPYLNNAFNSISFSVMYETSGTVTP
jgi:hypothetical protein